MSALSSDPSRMRNLADVEMVLNDCRSTKAELQWGLRVALRLAREAEARLREGEPIISAVEEIATRLIEARDQ